MPRWLVSTIICIGFLALIGLAFVPRVLTVNIEILDQSEHHRHGATHADAQEQKPPPGE